MLTKTELLTRYQIEGKTLREIGLQEGVSPTAVWKWMRRAGITRRSRSAAIQHHYNPISPFRMTPLSPNGELLKHIGVSLYWCEGTHREKAGRQVNTLALTNSSEKILKLWMKFLREVCFLEERKIRIRLYLHPDQNSQALLAHWSAILKIPLEQFESVSFTKKKVSKRNHDNYRGTVKVKVHSQALVQQVNRWLSELQDIFSEASFSQNSFA